MESWDVAKTVTVVGKGIHPLAPATMSSSQSSADDLADLLSGVRVSNDSAFVPLDATAVAISAVDAAAATEGGCSSHDVVPLSGHAHDDGAEDDELFDVDVTAARPPLRPYQHQILTGVEARMAKHFDGVSKVRSVLVYLPTGGGKTRVAAEVFLTCMAQRRRCLFIVNRNKLATQVRLQCVEPLCGCAGCVPSPRGCAVGRCWSRL